MRKNFVLIVTYVLLLSTLATGCYDMHEITDLAFVHFVGIDKGVNDKLRLTLKIASMRQKEGGDVSEISKGDVSKQKTNTQTVTIDAPSFYGGVSLLNTNIPQRINFSHTALLAISEEIARSGLVGEYVTPLIRFREMRRTIDIVVVSGTAQNFIESCEECLGGSPIRAIENLILETDNTGFFPHTTFNDFYNAIKSTYCQPVVTLGSVYNPENFNYGEEKREDKYSITGKLYAGEVPRKGGNTIEFLGSALFDGDRMVGKLDGHETRMMLLAKGDFKRGIFTIQDPKNPELVIPIDLRLARKPYVKVGFRQGVPYIILKLKTEGDIFAIQSRINYEDPKNLPVLEKAVEQYLKTSMDDLIKKCQSLNCDAFNFGERAITKFLTIEEWESYDWNKRFKDAVVNTEIEFKIRRTGGLLKNSQIIKSEGRE